MRRGRLSGPGRALFAGLVCMAPVVGVPAPALGQTAINKAPYAPYEFLIGTWEVSAGKGSRPFQYNRFRWGFGKSYIWFTGGNLVDGAEQPQFEGMLMWNGVSGTLDMLLATDLRYGLVQQKGTMSLVGDGEVVRDIVASFSRGVGRGLDPPAGPGGAVSQFSQTYKLVGPGRIATSVLRRVGGEWQPAHSGSDAWIMVRRGD